MNEVAVPNTVVREKILSFEGLLRQSLDHGYTEADCPLTHHFAPGAYGREIFIPQGAIVIGKIHKHAHLNVLSQGSVSVLTEDGPLEFSAPRTWVSSPGTKRVVFAHTDVVWTTVHVTDETDLDKIEEFVIAKTYDALDGFLQIGGRLIP
jgi:hypothetical protein